MDYEWKRIEENKARKEPFRDKIRGCLIGGAVGDALGYPVEFLSWNQICKKYGELGIQAYELNAKTGNAVISDDTQMTLFTANGILYGQTRGCLRGISGPVIGYVAAAYQDWLKTQIRMPDNALRKASWLNEVPELRAWRAPGNTCLNALESGKSGTIEKPINNSKGCGGVMRVAPIGLWRSFPEGPQRLAMDREGAQAAALTHGHPLGYIPAAMLTHIVNIGVYGGCSRGNTLLDAAEDALAAAKELFGDNANMAVMEALTRKAMELAAAGGPDEPNIRALGEGWTGEEAFVIALYCCLRYPDDFTAAVTAAVNHKGDSDSTGAIAGNILGAWLGYGAIAEKWRKDLELHDTILELADDLCYGCQMTEYGTYRDPVWLAKYVYCSRAATPEEGEQVIREIMKKWE